MLILLGSSSLAFAGDAATVGDTEIDIEFLEFLGETAGLESLGVDIDGLLGIDNDAVSSQAGGGQ